MANTYTQIHIQFVFAVQNRHGLILPSWKENLHQYITGIIQNNQHKVIQVNSMPDHIHILSGIRPHQALSQLIQNVKSESTKWVKKEKSSPYFEWQDGYGAFSYSKKDLPTVALYIQHQEKHHEHLTFLQEYRNMLLNENIDFNTQYIFKEPV
jgi:putative transposase